MDNENWIKFCILIALKAIIFSGGDSVLKLIFPCFIS